MARTALFTLLLIGAGCGMQSPGAIRDAPLPTKMINPSSTPIAIESPAPIPIEPNDAGLRTACATRVLDELIRAFNTGDALALGRMIGSGPQSDQGFRWVSFHDGIGRDAEYTADGARRMLLERWSRGQRLTLVSVSVSAGPNWDGGVGAGVRLESRAPGLTGTAPISGKTALSCVSARVYVLSIGDE